MNPSRPRFAALVGPAAMMAQCVIALAARDALFLTSLDVTALPAMLIVASLWSIAILSAHAGASRRLAPPLLMRATLVVSGTSFLVEYALRDTAPAAVAIAAYLHVTGATSLLLSGSWSISGQRLQQSTVARRIGAAAGGGALSAVLAALAAERAAALTGVSSILLLLGCSQFATAWLTRIDLPAAEPVPSDRPGRGPATSPRSQLRVIADAPHLRNLAALVLLGTTSAALLDYLFKATAAGTFGGGDGLLRFFALYYAGTGLATCLLHAASSRLMLGRFGLGLTASTPSIALLAGSAAALASPGFGSLLVARAGEAVFRGSWFQSGRKLFDGAPASARTIRTGARSGRLDQLERLDRSEEQRAARSIIDRGVDRLGDAVGGALIPLILAAAPVASSSAVLTVAMVAAVGALVAARRLNQCYLWTLERSAVSGGAPLDAPKRADESLRQQLVAMRRRRAGHLRLVNTSAATTTDRRLLTPSPAGMPSLDPELQDALALRTRDPRRVMEILTTEGGLPGALVHHAIPLLAVERLAEHAMFALCQVAEEHVGELGDALLDSARHPVIRHRLARVFAVCISQRAADVLMLALEDPRFDVRCQAARSLAAIRDKNPRLTIDRVRIHNVVLEEVSTVRPVWDSRRESLAHVFTLLSLLVPREPLAMVQRSLQSGDEPLRAQALAHLERVLPADIGRRLLLLLAGSRGRRPAPPPPQHERRSARL